MVELPNMTEEDYAAIEEYFTPLINSASLKSRDAIAHAFQFGVSRCPHENPSDLWHHVLYRIYLRNKRGTNPEQSWVRTSGEAFELILAQTYNPFLAREGIRLKPLTSKEQRKDALLRMGLTNLIGSSKIDLIIEKRGKGKGILLDGYGIVGGVHAKVSLAERVSDDIPASRIMMANNFLSILTTLDVKSFPPPRGDLVNRGELGSPNNPSDKRRYIEEHGDFSACFSYNHRTLASLQETRSGRLIYLAEFKNNLDNFVQFVVGTMA
jgi:hypothetical protein